MNLTNFAVSPDQRSTDTAVETNNGNENVVPLTAVIRDNMDALSNSILDFTNSLMKTEVKNND
jgi:hypothetical protein